MSLNSLASSRVASELPPQAVPRAVASSEDTLGPENQDVQNALSALVEYVPAETITLYLATLTALPALTKTITGLSAEAVYWCFGALTPILYILIYAGKRRAANLSRWPEAKDWPWWSMFAATVAFLAWGVAVPEGPFFDSADGRVVSGFIAIVVSTLLGVLARVFGPTPK